VRGVRKEAGWGSFEEAWGGCGPAPATLLCFARGGGTGEREGNEGVLVFLQSSFPFFCILEA
jgi:hypothetical protein